MYAKKRSGMSDIPKNQEKNVLQKNAFHITVIWIFIDYIFRRKHIAKLLTYTNPKGKIFT